jgi:hypothetical protein
MIRDTGFRSWYKLNPAGANLGEGSLIRRRIDDLEKSHNSEKQ